MLLLLLIAGLLLACTLSFIALSFRYNLNARTLLFKLLSRIGFTLEYLRPAEDRGPYKKLALVHHNVHRPVLLNLETSDGSGQACHPDVAYIPAGFGTERWTYWMVCTPYPNRDAQFENPELFASFDGVNWIIPAGVINPIVPPLKLPDHNSDPDVLSHNRELWLFYRQTIRSRTPAVNTICVKKSADGMRWSEAREILRENTGAGLFSPAVVHDGSVFRMWTIEIQDGEFRIMQRSSRDGFEWTLPQRCEVAGLKGPRHVWHIDVIEDSSRLSAALVSCVDAGGSKSRLHYAYSDDHGHSWTIEDFLFEQVYEFEASAQYRGTLRKREEPFEYDLWYSAACSKQMLSIAYVRLIREKDRLVPWSPVMQSVVQFDRREFSRRLVRK